MHNSRSHRLYKYFGIFLLTVQQISMPLLARSTRYRQTDSVFITTVNVFIMELIKVTTCSAILIVKYRSIIKFLDKCKESIVDKPLETAKICLPALLYTVQNNLYYIALGHLDATTFCLTYQMKTFTTAILLYIILNKKLSYMQWFSIVLLSVGVADVQMQYQPPHASNTVDADSSVIPQNALLGFCSVIVMCFTSGFAGVYLEKVLKQSGLDIWMQNIRLAVFGLPISALSMYINDYYPIIMDGPLRGFDRTVWIMTITNSIGGLLISIVIKYADNILKAFVQSAAIVGAAVGSWILFDFSPNLFFCLGALLIMSSIYIYNVYPYMEKKIPDNKPTITC